MAKLRTQWPADAIAVRQPAPDEQPIAVLSMPNEGVLGLLRQHLEARGIDARVVRPPLGAPVYEQEWGPRKLVVWSADADRAKGIISRIWEDA